MSCSSHSASRVQGRSSTGLSYNGAAMERRCGVLFQLMNKDKVVATYEEEKRLDDYRYTEIERLDGYVP